MVCNVCETAKQHQAPAALVRLREATLRALTYYILQSEKRRRRRCLPCVLRSLKRNKQDSTPRSSLCY